MKKILCFLYDTYADFEIGLVIMAINQAENYKMEYIAYETKPVKSFGGLTVTPDKSVADITQTDEIAGLIFPGGNNRVIKPELIKLVKKLNQEDKLLAAICAGPEFLAKMGILNQVEYTTSETPEMYKENNEEDPFPRDNFVDKRVVQDKNIITAQGFAFVDFALTVWDRLNLYDHSGEREELKKEFTPE